MDFCSLGTKYYIENFSEFLAPPEKQFLGRLPTVMVREADWMSLCQGLIERRVCGILPWNRFITFMVGLCWESFLVLERVNMLTLWKPND